MSEAVEELSTAFDKIIRNFGTVLGLGIGIAVFAYAAPYMIQATQLVKAIIPSSTQSQLATVKMS